MSGQSLVLVEICAGLFGVLYVALILAFARRRQGYARPMRPPRQEDLVAEDLVAAGASEQVAAHLAAGKTIHAIKVYKDETGVGLRRDTGDILMCVHG